MVFGQALRQVLREADVQSTVAKRAENIDTVRQWDVHCGEYRATEGPEPEFFAALRTRFMAPLVHQVLNELIEGLRDIRDLQRDYPTTAA